MASQRRGGCAWAWPVLMVLVLACSVGRAQEGSHAGHDHSMHVTAAAPAEKGFFGWLTEMYTPRRVCMNNEGDVVWTHVISDSFIALSYFSIPVALVYFVRRRKDITFNWVFYFFAVFILACGTTHVFDVVAVWYPMYRLDGWVKIVTAVASVGTAVALWPMIPSLLSIPSREQLRVANLQLEGEVARTRTAEEQVRKMADELEQRVMARTAELQETNKRLQHEVHHRMQVERERERLLESERAARSEAERANRMKDDFLATVSHELRTPINAIMGWTQMLRLPRAQASDLSEALEVIERNSRMQARLIEDLLDMSRIVSGKMQLALQETDMRGVVQAAIETVGQAATSREVEIVVETSADVPPIVADPARLQQIVWNLLSNAVKFSPKGSRIDVGLTVEGPDVVLCVKDRGQGIVKELLPYVFDRFQQGDSSMTRRHGGLGLGLAIVKNLTELHGGSVQVESGGTDMGATFVVRLPIASAGGERVGITSGVVEGSPLEIRLDGVKVLVVDDEEDALLLVKRLLEDHGAEVLTARSANEALARMDERVIDVIISDIGMPEEDGFTLMRQIRKLPESRGGMTPAVALTAFARSEDRVNALMSGFQSHLSKPADIRELLLTVLKLTENKHTS